MPSAAPASYELRQDHHDQEYKRAWDEAPAKFREQAGQLGMKPDVADGESKAIEFMEDRATASYTPDMRDLDTHVDLIVEEMGAEHEHLIRTVALRLEAPMRLEIDRGRSLMLGRVACFLVKGTNRNFQAKIHALFHAIPRLAAVNGFKSMRHSARECNVSVEWIRKSRMEWCNELGIPIPVENRKSDEASEKYSTIATGNHWRDQTFTPTHQSNQTTLCPPNQKPTRHHPIIKKHPRS